VRAVVRPGFSVLASLQCSLRVGEMADFHHRLVYLLCLETHLAKRIFGLPIC
jgi:hypothetical protein